MIFDTHAHYDDKAFDEDREQLLQRLPEQGISRVVNISSNLKSCAKVLELAEHYSYCYAAVGIHPSDSGELDEENVKKIEEQCNHAKCVAVGEIGLDYYWEEPEPLIQKKWFGRQMELARKLKLPIVVHSRDAARDTIEMMKDYKAEEIGGVIHCYSYSKETARAFLDMGFYFGIGGVLTFKNGKKLKEAVSYLPMDRMVLETDSPYLTPEPFRGKRNCSLYLPYIVSQLALMKGISEEEVERRTWKNACSLYRMEERL